MSFISSLFIGYFVLAYESIILILAGVLALSATLLLSKQFLEKELYQNKRFTHIRVLKKISFRTSIDLNNTKLAAYK